MTGKSVSRVLACLGLLLSLASSGCALPALTKLAKPKPKLAQDHFSCGENCPHAVKHGGAVPHEH